MLFSSRHQNRRAWCLDDLIFVFYLKLDLCLIDVWYDSSFRVSFNKKYKVIIERKTTEKVGQKEDKKDTIISLIEIN